MAADGLAPLSPTDLMTALYVLAFDGDHSLADKAKSTLAGLPATVVDGALAQLENAVVLDGLAQLLIARPEAVEKILLNRTLADETALWIAKMTADERTLEIIAANDQRLLANPAIIEALYNNKAARMSTVDRAVELAIRNGIELTGIASFAEVKTALIGEIETGAAEEPTSNDAVFKETLEREEWRDLDATEVSETLTAKEAGEDTSEETEEKVESLRQSLSTMAISAKIRLATLGTGAQRAVLIRDSNKLVVMAVIKAPSLRESEITQYSRYRSLPEEAIRHISKNREWTKQYTVKLNLVQNPRCPLEIALRFLVHLRTNDVRALERDKNVPQAVANAARKLRTKRRR